MSQDTPPTNPLPLSNRRIAALVTDGFERRELLGPAEALKAAGAVVHVISPAHESVRSWSTTGWEDPIPVDVRLDSADSKAYDALLLPGGVINADSLRTSHRAVDFARHFIASGKPVGAICHAAWLLIEAEAVEGVALTSYPSLRTDLINAGALWIDTSVVTDKGIVTSRHPGDIPNFVNKLIQEIAEGRATSARAA